MWNIFEINVETDLDSLRQQREKGKDKTEMLFGGIKLADLLSAKPFSCWPPSSPQTEKVIFTEFLELSNKGEDYLKMESGS